MATAIEIPLFTYGPADWAREPDTAFDAFLTNYRFQGRRLRESSFIIYRGMFGRLKDWAAQQGLTLFQLDETALEHFLQGRELAPETRHRYLLMFTTLFGHLAQLSAAQAPATASTHANPARVLLLEREAPEREDPQWLDPAAVKAFLAALPAGTSWKQIRSNALVHTVLGAGLRSSEVLALKLSDINRKQGFLASIWVQAHKPSPLRQVPIQLFAHSALQAWLTHRQTLGVAGELVFPANLAGAPLTPVTLFRLVKSTLETAGIVKRYEGPTLLRNTCGALWLQEHEPLEVMRWMGHATLRTTELLLPPEQRTKDSGDSAIATLALEALQQRARFVS